MQQVPGTLGCQTPSSSQEVAPAPSPRGSASFTHTVPGEHFSIPLFISSLLSTSFKFGVCVILPKLLLLSQSARGDAAVLQYADPAGLCHSL